MSLMTSVEAQKRFGELIDRAQREPIELRQVRKRRDEAARWYASYCRAATTPPEAAELTEEIVNRIIHELP